MTRELEGFSTEEDTLPIEPSTSKPTKNKKPYSEFTPQEGEMFRVRDLSEIYEEAKITPSPYPIERMIRLLDGLKAMPEEMRIQAVKAMDLADDTWTIEDSILDGQKKVQAVKNERERIKARLEARTKNIEEEKQKQTDYLQQMTMEIRQQIADLERILQEEAQQVSSKKSELNAEQKTTQHAYEETDFALKNHLSSIEEVIKSITK
jgi:hypothetical protein